MKTPKAVKLPSGRWRCRMRIRGRDISITKGSKDEAIAEALAIRAGLKQPVPSRASMTLGSALDCYIDARDGIMSPATIKGYKSIRKHRFQRAMELNLANITPEMWQSFLRNEIKQVSAKTVYNAWGLISSAMREYGFPVPKVSLPQQVKNEHPYLTAEQINIFLDAVRGNRAEVPILLGLHGLRRSELCALRWKDIDPKNNMILVRGAAVFNSENKLVTKKENKNQTSKREVPILIDRLSELLADARKDPDSRVVKYNPNSIYKAVNRICERADLPLIGAHGLRHSFASLCFHLGLPEDTTMLLGGWKDFQTMRKIYTHFSEDDKRKQVEALRGFFRGDEPENDHKNDHG